MIILSLEQRLRFNGIDSLRNDRCSFTDDSNLFGQQFIAIYWRVIKSYKRGRRVQASTGGER